MEATDLYSYLRAQTGELGARVPESTPLLQSTIRSNAAGRVSLPEAHFHSGCAGSPSWQTVRPTS